MKKWKIYIVTHKIIREEYYKNDPNFNNDNWGFINVSLTKLSNKDWYSKYNIIDMFELKNFKSLGHWFAETEAIYNIYLNNIHLSYDFIGFVHHDYELKDNKGGYNITEKINSLIRNYDLIYLSSVRGDYNARILADESKPNQLVGDGLNCYDYIISDYNNYYVKSETVDEWKYDIPKNICSAFLCNTTDFTEMMKFSSFVIESEKLNKFDTYHRHRFQGGIFERYFSVFLDKLNKPFTILELNHRWLEK